MIFVPSVPSTGTMFLVNLLVRHNQEVVWLHHDDNGVIDLALKERTITPLRDPGLVLCTWIDNKIGRKHILDRLSLWESVVAYDEAMKIEYVPVDLKHHRDVALQSLNLNLMTDWKPVNSTGVYKVRKEYLNGEVSRIDPLYWKKLKDLSPALRPLLERVGYRALPWWL